MTTITDDFEVQIADAITAIESEIAFSAPTFIESRYPHIYACDYVRAHKEALGCMGWPNSEMNLAEAANWLDHNSSDERANAVNHRLADAFLRENNISTVACGWCKEILIRAPGLIWVTRSGEGHCPTPDSPNRAHKPRDVRPRSVE
jgi:hypothetical protein